MVVRIGIWRKETGQNLLGRGKKKLDEIGSGSSHPYYSRKNLERYGKDSLRVDLTNTRKGHTTPKKRKKRPASSDDPSKARRDSKKEKKKTTRTRKKTSDGGFRKGWPTFPPAELNQDAKAGSYNCQREKNGDTGSCFHKPESKKKKQGGYTRRSRAWTFIIGAS